MTITNSMANNFKLMYPVISDYKYDLSKMLLDKRNSKKGPKKGSKKR